MRRQSHKLITRRDKLLVRLAVTSLQVEIKTADVAQLDHRGWHDRKDKRFTDLGKDPKGPSRNCLGAAVRRAALVPVLEAHKGETHVLALPGETETTHGEQ